MLFNTKNRALYFCRTAKKHQHALVASICAFISGYVFAQNSELTHLFTALFVHNEHARHRLTVFARVVRHLLGFLTIVSTSSAMSVLACCSDGCAASVVADTSSAITHTVNNFIFSERTVVTRILGLLENPTFKHDHGRG